MLDFTVKATEHGSESLGISTQPMPAHSPWDKKLMPRIVGNDFFLVLFCTGGASRRKLCSVLGTAPQDGQCFIDETSMKDRYGQIGKIRERSNEDD